MKTILLKVSGEIISDCMDHVNGLILQLKTLQSTHRFAIVIGGGNFFRTRQLSKDFKLRQSVSDAVGMLATSMNGLILQECFQQQGLSCKLLSAIPLPSLAEPINQSTIDQAFLKNKHIIFCGGSGNPYFTTDTTAVLRALQIGATEVWKGTNVDYVYDSDPKTNKASRPIQQLKYFEVLQKQLKIMDLTAITLAQQYSVKIRIFNIFSPNILKNVANNPDIGSTIN